MNAAAPEMGTRSRRDPHLDGLRGLAIVMVVAGHLVGKLALLASAGVAVFFALSGYLITGLLLAERERTGRLDLLRFYRRRASRLMPSLLLVVAVTVLWCAVWGVYQRTMGRDLAETLTYVSNWGMVGGSFTVPLRHTWSLAIEEQFYLLWPLVVVLCAGGRRRLTAVAAAGVLVSLVIRLLLSRHSADQVYYRSESNAVLVLLGCLAACANGPRLQRLRAVPLLGTAGLALAVVGYKGLPHLTHSLAAVYGVGLPLVGTGATLFILYGTSRSLVSMAPLRWLGGISYTLYLWQTPVLYSGVGHGPLGSSPAWLVLPIALPLAWLTSRYLERPVMRWDRARAGRPVKGLEAAGVHELPRPRAATTADAQQVNSAR